MKKLTGYLGLLLLIANMSGEARAQGLTNVDIHGFGGWAYGRTDNGNRYLVGNEDGKYDTVNFSLNLTATPSDRLAVHVQTAYNEGTFDGDDVGLDYAFAEWYFSDHLRLRIGKVKAPFMLSTEIYDVGTLRPFFLLPQGVYRQFAAEAYKGIGLAGFLSLWDGWEIAYDLYGGKLALQANPVLNYQTATFGTLVPQIRNLIGSKLSIQPPMSGLSVAVSVCTGEVFLEITGSDRKVDSENAIVVGISGEYLSERWSLRSEYLMQREAQDSLNADVAYVEGAYKFTPQWQAALRYEWADFDFTSPEILALPPSFVEHEEFSFGLNYWWNVNLVVKLSYHIVNGNRFAFPESGEDFIAAVQQGGFDDPTHLFVSGIQFSF